MSINDFMANYRGGARPTKFRVQITWPALVGTPNVPDEYRVEAALLPASTLGVIQVPYKGRQIPVPGDRTFEAWTCTFNNDTDFSHRNALERWHEEMNGFESNLQSTDNYRNLVSTINVVQLGVDDAILKTYRLFNAWPSEVGQIDLGYDQNDTVEKFPCTWSYSHFESV